jgi:hypothetical protein
MTRFSQKNWSGEVGIRLRELIPEVCRTNDVEILQVSIVGLYSYSMQPFVLTPSQRRPSQS